MSQPDRRDGDRPSASVHRPVLLRETLAQLALEPGLTVVDGTVGGGGHSLHILKQIGTTGRLVGLDRDPMMLSLSAEILSAPNCSLHHASYAQLDQVLDELGIAQVDRLLLDLGLSSDQLADRDRGFGFEADGPLDLRFDPSAGEPAWERLRRIDAVELERVLREYGEERFAPRIAAAIVDARSSAPLRTARDLSACVERAVPREARRDARKHPATRVFQALRIFVNDELRQLESILASTAHDRLRAGGRLVVITFHSLEDRFVKSAFRDSDRWQNLTPKPVTATATERRMNPRCRTAKLRAAIRK